MTTVRIAFVRLALIEHRAADTASYRAVDLAVELLAAGARLALISARASRSCHHTAMASRFALSSGRKNVEPVTLASGLARFDTSPVATASPLMAITIGMVEVACFAARVPGVFRA